MADVEVAGIRPDATDDEVAAIVAALEIVWPRGDVGASPVQAASRWRFSGRWWAKPVPMGRSRP